MSETITITGNVATDPEQRNIGEGVTVTSFRVACTHRRFDRSSGKWVDQYTNWYSVSAFRSLGEHAFASLHRGDRVIVTGRLRLREWDNGTRRGTTAEIDADALGPDLLWGITTYRRSGDVDAGAGAEPSGVVTAPAGRTPADPDEWGVPGGSSDDTRSGEPVLAAGGTAGGGHGGETPF